jgi:hypothetical protein
MEKQDMDALSKHALELISGVVRYKSSLTRKYLQADNAAGNLAWRESWLMMSLMEMYRATGDCWFLDELVHHADLVWSWRDNLRGKQCEVRQRSLPAWGSTGFSNNKWHVWLVHAGTIMAPIADFTRLAFEKDELRASYGSKAREYLALINDTCEAFDDDWVEDCDTGYYKFPDGYFTQLGGYDPLDPHPLPINMYGAFAITLIDFASAAKLINDQDTWAKYQSRAEKMARFTFDKIQLGATPETFNWNYGFGRMKTPEDSSHGGLTVMFIYKAFCNKIVFTRQDMESFSEVFTRRIIRPDGSLSSGVNGSNMYGSEESIQNVAFFWIDLCVVSREVFAPCHEIIINRQQDLEQLGFAKVLKWKAMGFAEKK